MEKTGKFLIEAMDLDNAGNASSTIKKILIEEGISKQIIKRVSIAVYEAEINVVIHSYGGTCTYFIDDQKIRIIFEDTGPGIVDIEQALEPGFSTANNQAIYYGFGAGMGLMNIKNASDEFDNRAFWPLPAANLRQNYQGSSPAGTTLDIQIYFN